MATVRKRGEYWYYRFKVRDGQKYRYIERGGNFRTKAEAIRAGCEAERQWATHLNIFTPREVLYSTLLQEYQINFCNLHYKGSTLSSIRKDINIVGQYLGDKYIHLLTAKMLQEVITDLASRGYTRNRLGKIKSVMYKSLRYAQENGMIKLNVATAVYVPSPRAAGRLGCSKSRELRALTPDELKRILERFPEGTTAFIPLILGMRCGMRLGECFGLEIKDVDIEKKQIHVKQQLGYHGQRAEVLTISEPKYESSRVIDLDSDTFMILERHIQKLKVLESIAGDNYHRYYVASDGIVSEKPGPREVDFLNRKLDGSGKLTGPRIMQHVARVLHGMESSMGTDTTGKMNDCIPDYSFHQLRHTHCSQLLANGFDIQFVSARLGHKHPDTCWRYYSHLLPEVSDKAVDQLRNFYS